MHPRRVSTHSGLIFIKSHPPRFRRRLVFKLNNFSLQVFDYLYSYKLCVSSIRAHCLTSNTSPSSWSDDTAAYNELLARK